MELKTCYVIILFGVFFLAEQCQTVNSHCEQVDDLKQLQVLYTRFEEAIVNDPLNLYIMRNAFFPVDVAEPIVVAVTYVANFTYSECFTNSSHSVAIDFVWTSSAVFSALDPYVLELLQPGLLYILNPITFSLYGQRKNIDLALTVADLPFVPSRELAIKSVTELTTLLKTYTNKQGKLEEEWYSEYPRGYTTQKASFAGAFFIMGTLTTMLMMVAVLALVREVHMSRLFGDYIARALSGERPHSILLVSVYVDTAITNWCFIITELINLIAWFEVTTEQSYERYSNGITYSTLRVAIVTKFFLFLLICAMSVVVAIYLTHKSQRNTKLPKQIQWFVLLFSFGFVVYGFIYYLKEHTQQMVYKTVVAWNFLVFIMVVTWSIVPTLILIFAAPLPTIAITTFFISFFFLALFSFAIALAYPSASYKCINISLTIVAGIMLIMMFLAYLAVIRAGFTANGSAEIFITLGPSLFTAGAAWLSRKFLQKFVASNPSSDPGDQQKSDVSIELESCEETGSPDKQFVTPFVSVAKETKSTTIEGLTTVL